MSVTITAIVILGGIGVVCALLLYATAARFHVDEDPRIAEIEELLPGANCGGADATDAMTSHVPVLRPPASTGSIAPEPAMRPCGA